MEHSLCVKVTHLLAKSACRSGNYSCQLLHHCVNENVLHTVVDCIILMLSFETVHISMHILTLESLQAIKL